MEKKNFSNKKQYYTLVSEFMLQQTQVTTVIPYFNRFIKNIPNLEALQNLMKSKLIKLLGRTWLLFKSKKFKKNCTIIIKDFNKRLPNTFET